MKDKFETPVWLEYSFDIETLVGKRSFIINRNIRTTTNIILSVISEKTNRSKIDISSWLRHFQLVKTFPVG